METTSTEVTETGKSLKYSSSLEVDQIGTLQLNDKHLFEYNAMSAKVKKLDLTIHDLLQKIANLHHKRSKMASAITQIVNRTKTTKKEQTESLNITHQNDRMKRLNACSRLLGNRYNLSSITTNAPLPDLPPPPAAPTSNTTKSSGVNTTFDKKNLETNQISQYIKTSQPDLIANFLNEIGICYLLLFCMNDFFDQKPLQIDLKNILTVVPPILSSVNPPTRQIILKAFFKSMTVSAHLTSLFEESFHEKDILRLINLIETQAAGIVNARRARLFLASDNSNELIHMNGNVRVVVPLDNKGLISDCVHQNQFVILTDPKNSPILDVALETPLFEGSRNAILCPLHHPSHKLPFVFMAVDKLREPNFAGVDFVLLYFLFEFLSFAIETVHAAVTTVTEEDQTRLMKGLASIASEKNAHNMIQKICDVGRELTSAANCRVFSIIDNSMFEETPGLKIYNKPISFDNGLIGKSIMNAKTLNVILPRREPEFSVQVDDITEPRVWSMLTSPAVYNGDITMNITLYNRSHNTFFSAKEVELLSIVSNCICPFIYRTCELAKLNESLSWNSTNSNRSYNLTVFSLKAIETTGTDKIFKEMQRFCDTVKPKITHRILIYDADKLMKLPDMNVVASEPQLLDAICTMKPTAATNGDRAVLVFPIKIEGIKKVYLMEFSANLLQLKTTEEQSGLMQRTRLLQAMEEIKVPNDVSPLSKLVSNSPFSNTKGPGMHRAQSRVGFTSVPNRMQSKGHFASSFDLSNAFKPKMNLPYIPLNLKNANSNTNNDSFSLFDLGDEHQKSSDKMIVVKSARSQQLSETNSISNFNTFLKQSAPSFENQLDEDSLQIFPFDPFLTTILQSFSNHSARQILLHMEIASMNKYRLTTRSLHILGNSLSSPLMFSKLVEIMMAAFTNLFGKDVTIRIFDPPLNDVIETDSTTFNLERDRMIFASIKIPTALNPEKSTALASFADLLTNLIESRAESVANEPVKPERNPKEEDLGLNLGIDFECSHLTSNEMVSIVSILFERMHVKECLNCDDLLLTKWIGTIASKTDESGLFMMMTNSLFFVNYILTETSWIDYFNPSEQCALALSVFLGLSYPQLHPNFKYEQTLAKAVNKNTNQRSLTRVATILVYLADDSVDLLINTNKSILLGLIELMLQQTPKSSLASLVPFHIIQKRGLDLEDDFHKVVLKQFLIDASLMSLYFAPISSFGMYIVSLAKEPVKNILLKATTIVKRFAEEFADASEKLEFLPQKIDEKVDWMNKQNLREFVRQQTEEEEEENMSLMDAH